MCIASNSQTIAVKLGKLFFFPFENNTVNVEDRPILLTFEDNNNIDKLIAT